MVDIKKIKTSQDFYNIDTTPHSGYVMDKYRGREIYDALYDRTIKVDYIFDLKFEDLDLEDQRLAVRTGWAWGVGEHIDPEQCKHLQGYLFTPKQWRLWHSKEKFPAFIGAEGSGKTLIFWLYLIMIAMHNPGTRLLFMRATYPQLLKASLPTLWKIFAHFGWKEGKQYDHHTSNKIIILHHGNNVSSEILYMPAKNEGNDIMSIIEDLRSLEIDAAVLDEIANIDELVCRGVRSRVGRWGKIKNPRFRKMIVGGNPPPEGSWIHKRWYQKLDNNDNKIDDADQHTVFVASSYENRRNLAPDIIKTLESSEEYWKNTFLYGRLGFVPPDGEPIFKNFNYKLYVSDKPLTYNPKSPLLRGWDIGPTAKNKACLIATLDSRGVLVCLAELMMNDPGVVKFGNYVKMQTEAWFPEATYVRDFCDPVAFHTSQTDGQSPAGLLREIGIDLIPGEESFQLRYDAVMQVMNRLIDGAPGLYIDGTRCRKLVEGFMGGYRYKVIDLPNERFSREPVKDVFSHCLHPDSMIACPDGDKRITDIRIGDYVITPNGKQRVMATMNQEYEGDIITISLSNGRELICTANHPVYTDRGIVRADGLCYDDILCPDPENIYRKISTESGSILNPKDITSQTTTSMAGSICTGKSGDFIMGKFLMDSISTILTGIKGIMKSAILKSCRQAFTPLITLKKTILNIQTGCAEVSILLGSTPNYGMVPMLAGSGIANTLPKYGLQRKRNFMPALFAGGNTSHISRDPIKVIAPLTASRNKEEDRESITSIESVSSAEMNTVLINTPSKKPVVRIAGLKARKERMRVYDLTVENEHCFYAEGILVGNCQDALQYVCSRLGFINTKKRDESKSAQHHRNRALINKRRRLLGKAVGFA